MCRLLESACPFLLSWNGSYRFGKVDSETEDCWFPPQPCWLFLQRSRYCGTTSGAMYAYMKRGQDEKAIPVAKLGAENVPEARVSFLDTLGNLYLKLGRPDQAVEYFKTSTAETVRMGMTPFYQAGYFNNLGVAYMALAKTVDEARRAEA